MSLSVVWLVTLDDASTTFSCTQGSSPSYMSLTTSRYEGSRHRRTPTTLPHFVQVYEFLEEWDGNRFQHISMDDGSVVCRTEGRGHAHLVTAELEGRRGSDRLTAGENQRKVSGSKRAVHHKKRRQKIRLIFMRPLHELVRTLNVKFFIAPFAGCAVREAKGDSLPFSEGVVYGRSARHAPPLVTAVHIEW